MEHAKASNLPIYRFDNLRKFSEVMAVVTTRFGGISEGPYTELNLGLHVGDDCEKVINNREILSKAIGIIPTDITCGEQTHGTKVQIVTKDDKGRGATVWKNGFPNTDALVTNAKNTPLAVLTADCAAIFFYDPENQAIGIVHSGRKGTENEISIKVIQTMHDTFGTCAENLIAGIGPCIYPCCYDVDLPNTIRNQLLEAGVRAENIEVSGICTSCHNDIFYSYRARGDNPETGRFMNLIMLKG